MKRILASILAVLSFSLGSFAQTETVNEPDSTKYHDIVAYYTKVDTLIYKVTVTEKNASDSDTTIVSSFSSNIFVTVTDSTSAGYALELIAFDSNADSLEFETQYPTSGTSVVLLTDELGQLVSPADTTVELTEQQKVLYSFFAWASGNHGKRYKLGHTAFHSEATENELETLFAMDTEENQDSGKFTMGGTSLKLIPAKMMEESIDSFLDGLRNQYYLEYAQEPEALADLEKELEQMRDTYLGSPWQNKEDFFYEYSYEGWLLSCAKIFSFIGGADTKYVSSQIQEFTIVALDGVIGY